MYNFFKKDLHKKITHLLHIYYICVKYEIECALLILNDKIIYLTFRNFDSHITFLFMAIICQNGPHFVRTSSKRASRISTWTFDKTSIISSSSSYFYVWNISIEHKSVLLSPPRNRAMLLEIIIS